jgi:hypothetical protein
MALRHRYGVALVIAACGLIAMALLPPRLSDEYRGGARYMPTAEGMDVRYLAELRRRAAWAWLDAVRADTVATLLRETRTDSSRAPTLVFDPALNVGTRSEIEQLVRAEWRSLGIAEPVIPVAVAVLAETSSVVRGYPRAAFAREEHQYVLSASIAGGRRPCVTILRLGKHGTRDARSYVTEVARSGTRFNTGHSVFGPCAFYAAFGAPGQKIGAWLDRHQLLYSRNADWSSQPVRARYLSKGVHAGLAEISDVIATSLQARACRLGDFAACEATILANEPAPEPANARGWWETSLRIEDQGAWHHNERRFLADLRREMGPEKFAKFWTSPAEPEVAFASAFGMSLGEWTHHWSVKALGPTVAGAKLPRSRPFEGVLIIVGALGVASFFAQRRQVG